MNRFFSLIAFSCGIFLAFDVKPLNPISFGIPVASIACGCYFLLATYLASPSEFPVSSVVKTGVRVSFCVVALYCLLGVVSPFQKDRPIARQKSCLANLRVIASALETYNAEASSSNRITSLEMKDVVSGGILVTSGHLPSGIGGLSDKCLYRGRELTGRGAIICDYHGSVENPSELPETFPNIPKAISNVIGLFFFLMAMLYIPFVIVSQMFGKGSPDGRQ